jgi:heat shock protein HslJ
MIHEMNRVVRRGAAALALILAGCTSSSAPPERQAELAGPVWGAVSIAGKAVLDDALITLEFDGAGNAFGSGGCNRFHGPYTLDGSSLRFGVMGSTMMACEPGAMEQERTFLDALDRVERQSVADDGALVLTTSDGKEIRFLRQ